MTHLFKVPLQHSDMFVSALNAENQTITWQIFTKEGKPMEPVKTEKYTVHNGEFLFDKNRAISLQLAETINETLNA